MSEPPAMPDTPDPLAGSETPSILDSPNIWELIKAIFRSGVAWMI